MLLANRARSPGLMPCEFPRKLHICSSPTGKVVWRLRFSLLTGLELWYCFFYHS